MIRAWVATQRVIRQRGRIYRVAPPTSKYTIPKYDYTSPAGAVTALQNPNLAVRYHAWTAFAVDGRNGRTRTREAYGNPHQIPECAQGHFGCL